MVSSEASTKLPYWYDYSSELIPHGQCDNTVTYKCKLYEYVFEEQSLGVHAAAISMSLLVMIISQIILAPGDGTKSS